MAHSAFIEGGELATGEQEVFSTPGISAHSATVWDHCLLALERAGFEIHYRFRSTQYEITVQRCATPEPAIELDGQPPAAGFITLTDDGGVHKATVRFS